MKISVTKLSILLLLSAALLPACKPQPTAQESGNRPEAQSAGGKEPQTAAPADFCNLQIFMSLFLEKLNISVIQM